MTENHAATDLSASTLAPPALPPTEERPRLKLVPYRLAVCGQPLSRREYFSHLTGIDKFRVEHASDVRHTLDRIYRLGGEMIEMLVVNAHNPVVPEAVRADCAFTALAWYTFFNPFAHPKRKFIFRADRLVPVVEKNADTLYKYGVFIKQLPDPDVHIKLKQMHIDTARQYFDYCANVTVARMAGVDLDWITAW